MRSSVFPERSVDLSELFPEYSMAYGVVDGDFVDVKLVRAVIGEGEYKRAIGLDVRIDINRLANSLEKLRREQEHQRACK